MTPCASALLSASNCLLKLTFRIAGDGPVSVVRIVVVQRPVRVHVTSVVGVAGVR